MDNYIDMYEYMNLKEAEQITPFQFKLEEIDSYDKELIKIWYNNLTSSMNLHKNKINELIDFGRKKDLEQIDFHLDRIKEISEDRAKVEPYYYA